MTNKEFMNKAVELVRRYLLSYGKDVAEEDIYIVWYCKTLQNHKALVSTKLQDKMYYEITYNGDKNEIYFDAYQKKLNKAIKLEEIE